MPSENDTEETRDENDKGPLNPSTPPSSRNLSLLDDESLFSSTAVGSRRQPSLNGCEVETPKDIELIVRIPS